MALLTPIALAALLAFINKAVIDYLSAPLRKKFPAWDFWWLVYLSFITGALLAFAVGVDLFVSVLANHLVGQILTSAAVGAGSNFLYSIVKAIGGGGVVPVVVATDAQPMAPPSAYDIPLSSTAQRALDALQGRTTGSVGSGVPIPKLPPKV